MLQSPSSSEFDYNRTACISGSREVVQVYIRMRELAGGRINLCRVVDFQVFMAAVIVILGLLGYRPTSAPRNYSQEAEDWNLVYQTMEVLKVVSAEPENLIAAQCFQALEALVSIANGPILNQRRGIWTQDLHSVLWGDKCSSCEQFHEWDDSGRGTPPARSGPPTSKPALKQTIPSSTSMCSMHYPLAMFCKT